jgi:hypothetical protein
MDRSFLNIYIESEYEDGYSLPLSFIRDYIYNPDHIGFFNFPDNASNVNHLNDFIRKDFNKIVDLYSRDKYKITYNMIEQLLAEQRKN